MPDAPSNGHRRESWPPFRIVTLDGQILAAASTRRDARAEARARARILGERLRIDRWSGSAGWYIGAEIVAPERVEALTA